MTVSIYVDGSGSPKSGFGWFVKETGKSHYTRLDGAHVTNNQAEYMAILSALKYVRSDPASSQGGAKHDANNQSDHKYDDKNIVIYSDSLNTVKQLNHEYAINNKILREFAMQAWSEMAKITSYNLDIVWVRRQDNLAGKMLGS